jgi:transposase
MPKGVEVSSDLCWTVARMLGYSVPKATISLYADVSPRTIHEIQSRFCATGSPALPKSEGKRGRRSRLTESNLKVCGSLYICCILLIALFRQFIKASVERRPDMYLQEIAYDLASTCNVMTSESSVWRALRGMGMTRKRVNL